LPLVLEVRGDGISAAVSPRNVGAAGDPVAGPANTVLAVSVTNVIASVPAAVTGLPPTLKIAGAVSPTLVTVPVPDAAVHPVAFQLESTPLA
jgi:hypothetical protein